MLIEFADKVSRGRGRVGRQSSKHGSNYGGGGGGRRFHAIHIYMHEATREFAAPNNKAVAPRVLLGVNERGFRSPPPVRTMANFFFVLSVYQKLSIFESFFRTAG